MSYKDAKNFSLMDGVLIENATETSARDYRLKIRLPQFRPWEPGQFVMLRWGRHVIGRPFAIVDWQPEAQGSTSIMEVWIRRLGAGTEELFALAKENLALNVTAPLGRGCSDALTAERVLFLSGGVGAASILPLVHKRLENKNSHLWIHGERDEAALDRSWRSGPSNELPHIYYFEKGKESSQVQLGRITDAFSGDMDKRLNEAFDAIVACGPSAMLEALIPKVRSFRPFAALPIWIGLEEKMGCGIGLCFSCSVSTQSGLQRCCLEGPWFEAQNLKNHFQFRKTGVV